MEAFWGQGGIAPVSEEQVTAKRCHSTTLPIPPPHLPASAQTSRLSMWRHSWWGTLCPPRWPLAGDLQLRQSMRARLLAPQRLQHSPAGCRPARPPVALISQLPGDTSRLRALAGDGRGGWGRESCLCLVPQGRAGCRVGLDQGRGGSALPARVLRGVQSVGSELAVGGSPPGSPGAVLCPSSLSSSGSQSNNPAINSISPGEGFPGASLHGQSPGHHPPMASQLQACKPLPAPPSSGCPSSSSRR